GGPDGGDAGHGGDIIFMADGNMTTLMDFRYKKKYVAPRGEDGGAKKMFGKDGVDLIIRVPVGTLIKEASSGDIMADLNVANEKFIAAKGGKGGWGNQHFATSTRQTPKFAKSGLQGDECEVILELKLLADVGLVGFPNVGKSTILSVVTAARPKIANYHFTTLDPNLGVVDLGGGNSFVLADIPGIIEGAHTGIGLGHEFLRHIERTRLLIHVVDVSGIEGRDPLVDFDTINEELKQYNPLLADKQQIVVANKMDLPSGQENFEAFKNTLEQRGLKVFGVSAGTAQGVREVMLYVSSMLKDLPVVQFYDAKQAATKVYKVEQEAPFTVKHENGVYIVEGKWIQSLMGSTNFEDSESLQYFQRAILRKGVVKALEDAGCTEGDCVKMYALEFDFIK
ncbi:MAG: GTPase ObgE, partial [Hyphomonadaceae bacterium]|nr:GTPase ObgE [Clostridia bacterium]